MTLTQIYVARIEEMAQEIYDMCYEEHFEYKDHLIQLVSRFHHEARLMGIRVRMNKVKEDVEKMYWQIDLDGIADEMRQRAN